MLAIAPPGQMAAMGSQGGTGVAKWTRTGILWVVKWIRTGILWVVKWVKLPRCYTLNVIH